MQNEATLLTITQAAQFLKVSPDTLRRWEDKGIVAPARTKGGSRRYTLLDLKIARLNKQSLRSNDLKQSLRSNDLKQSLRSNDLKKKKQNYINSGKELKIALLTSFLWIFGFLIYHFLFPVFLRPTNLEQQTHLPASQLGEPDGQDNLKIASETTPNEANFSLRNKISEITVLVLPDPAPVANEVTPKAISQGSDLLIHRFSNLPTLQYTNTLNQYYSLQPLPQNQIPTLIKRT